MLFAWDEKAIMLSSLAIRCARYASKWLGDKVCDKDKD